MAAHTKQEILEKATELYMREQAKHPELGETMPEYTELLEGGFIDRANSELNKWRLVPAKTQEYEERDQVTAMMDEYELKIADLERQVKILKAQPQPDIKVVYVNTPQPEKPAYDPLSAPYTDSELYEIQEYLKHRKTQKPKKQRNFGAILNEPLEPTEFDKVLLTVSNPKKLARKLWQIIY